MALTADQRAMLQLLLERGQSYDDLASVLGVGVDEVRTRARAALTELVGGADPDAEVGLTDYLLGQADPIGRADAVRHLQADPESHRLASELRDRLLEISPDARLPELPEPKGRRRPAPSAPTRPRGTMTRRQQQTIVALVAAAVLVLVGILAVAGAFGGGDDDEPVADTQTTTSAEAQEEGDVLASVELRPQSGSDATGEATFGVASQDQPYVDVSLSGLNPPSEGETYVVWLLLTDNQGYPLSPLEVSGEGEFSDRFPIPQFAIPIASRARFVDISLSQNRSLLGDLRQAVKQQKPILRYQGDRVLRGEIPAQAAAQGGGASTGQGGGGGDAGGG